jgi:hypothetical protein
MFFLNNNAERASFFIHTGYWKDYSPGLYRRVRIHDLLMLVKTFFLTGDR